MSAADLQTLANAIATSGDPATAFVAATTAMSRQRVRDAFNNAVMSGMSGPAFLDDLNHVVSRQVDALRDTLKPFGPPAGSLAARTERAIIAAAEDEYRQIATAHDGGVQ